LEHFVASDHLVNEGHWMFSEDVALAKLLQEATNLHGNSNREDGYQLSSACFFLPTPTENYSSPMVISTLLNPQHRRF
jgi:hypothetical protein